MAPATKQKLARFGSKDESFDHIVQRLMEEAGWMEQEANWNRILRDESFTPLRDL